MLPAATIAEGVLGKEAEHAWNGFILNRLGEPLPRFKIADFGGLRDRADADNNSAPYTARDGEAFYPSALRGKTVVYTGVLYAEDLPQLRVYENQFLSAFTPQAPGTMVVSPPASRGGVAWFYLARCLSATIDQIPNLPESQRPSPWQSEFIATLRMPLPVFFEDTLNEVTSAPGVSYVHADNAGNAPAYPTIHVDQTGGDTNVLNLTTGTALRFNALPTGTLAISFQDRTATVGSDDAIPYLDDDDSDWWNELVPGMIPGDNQIKQEGGSGITVHWRHTSY